MMSGGRWCIQENLVNVALFIENPPHTQYTESSPTTGTTVMELVVTVAAQKLIWPHGETYPRNAVPIGNKYIVTPVNHTPVLGYWYELKYEPRSICMYKREKENDAPFACI
jgi:phage terminase large subunit-like protein